MIYTTVSSEEVIDRVLRRTRLVDATYADDMIAWLGEFVGNFRLRNYVKPAYKQLVVQNHIVKLPCGLKYLDGILYNGCRLRFGASKKDPRITNSLSTSTLNSYFVTDTTSDGFTKNEQSYLLLRGDDLKMAVENTNHSEYYITYPNYVQTSFEEGTIIIFYQTIPLSVEGYALIPDEENCINAAVWYVYAMLALTGYKHNDPRMDYEYCEQKYLKYLGKGKRKIRMPSDEQKERLAQMTVNLIPPQGYYDKFFHLAEQPKYVNK